MRSRIAPWIEVRGAMQFRQSIATARDIAV